MIQSKLIYVKNADVFIKTSAFFVFSQAEPKRF